MREEGHVNCRALFIHQIHLNVRNNILQQFDAVLDNDKLIYKEKYVVAFGIPGHKYCYRHDTMLPA